MGEITEKENFELFGAVPYFDGESNGIQVDEFLDKIDMTGSLMKWKDETKITVAKLKLKGTAQRAVKHCSNFKDVTWDKFKEELKEYYSLPFHEVKNLMLNCKQRRNETARDWSWRFMDIANKCGRFCQSPEENEKFKAAFEQEDWCQIYLNHVENHYRIYYLNKTWDSEKKGETVKLADIVNYVSGRKTEYERKPDA